jgi:hypothetical protein
LSLWWCPPRFPVLENDEDPQLLFVIHGFVPALRWPTWVCDRVHSTGMRNILKLGAVNMNLLFMVWFSTDPRSLQ